MPIITFKTADVLRNQILEAGWKSFNISKIEGPTASKAGDSFNFTFTFTLINDDNLQGKELYRTFNSKAIGMMIPLYEAVTGKKVEPKDFDIDTDELLNGKFDGKVIQDTYEGKPKNDIAEFAPFGTGASSNVQVF